MKLTRRKLVGAILVAMLLGSNSIAYGIVLHQETTSQTITKGAQYINEKLLTDDGWRNVNILRVDLNEDNVAVRPIESSTGTTRKTILQLVTESGAIAGVNADFFDMSSNSSNSFGPVIVDGELKHAYNSNYTSFGPNKYMGTLLIDEDNKVSMGYYGLSLRIMANNTFVGAAATYNVLPSNLTRPIILDATYLKTTNNAISKWQATYGIVVENDVVTYQTKADEVVNIPENGYVILIPSTMANEYYTQLKVGTSVTLQDYLYLGSGITKAIEDMKVGIGGGGMIMQNGEAFTGSAHKITPNSNDPRTIVATVKDTNEMLLITIDGRGDYTGIKHSDLVSLLKRYNVKDAMYFDGGGSTTFVSRTEGSSNVELQNNPSNGVQRKVINGLGVFTTSSTGSLHELLMTSTYDRTFIGESISFSFKGVDENYNPVTVDSSQIAYSVSGVEGTFEGNTFTPTTAGKAFITATCGNASVTKEVMVSNAPIGIQIEPSNLQIDENSSKTIQVYGIDAEGYKRPLDASKLTWTSTNNSVGAKGNTIVSGNKCVATLTASYKGISTKMGVIVGSTTTALESFETNTASWGGDTSSVVGNVQTAYSEKYQGSKSIKMSYTFSKSNNKQVAYTIFDTPIEIPLDAMSINMWVYANKQNHVAKLEVVDYTGQKFYLKLSDGLDYTGWQYLSASLPSDLVLPAKVTKFYTYANTMDEKLSTYVYLDHVSITRGIKEKEGISIRADYLYDPWYKETLQGAIEGQYIINAVGSTKINSMTLSQDTISKIGNKLGADASAVLFVTNSNYGLNLGKTSYTYKNTYQVNDFNNTRMIMVPTGSGSIRKTDTSAWLNVKSAIESTNNKHIILVMSKNPLTQFSDAKEGQLFHDYLVEQQEKNKKNIIVVYPGGTQPEVRIEDGIRYIRTNGLNTVTDNVADGTYIKFKIDNDQIYYTFEKFK